MGSAVHDLGAGLSRSLRSYCRTNHLYQPFALLRQVALEQALQARVSGKEILVEVVERLGGDR